MHDSDLPDLPRRCDLRNYDWTLDEPYTHDPPEDMDFFIWLKVELHNAVECGTVDECSLTCDQMYNKHKERVECKEVSVVFR